MRPKRELGQPSDIAFLLIIFFLLLAGINTSQSIALHQNSSGSASLEAKSLQALLLPGGTVLSDGTTYSLDEFVPLLTSGTTLHLLVEGSVPWQEVVDLLSLAEQRGVEGLSLTLSADTEGTL